MDKILELYVSEKFHYEKENIEFSCPKIDIQITNGEVIRGSFFVTCANDIPMEGFIYTNNSRMKYQPAELNGDTTEVFYEFHSLGMDDGDTLNGSFDFITNNGEASLPFLVEVNPIVIESSLGEIKNLFHFTNLAKENWQEAINVFYKQEMISIFKENDKQYFGLYKGLVYDRGNQHNVDTFLVEINKKQAIQYRIEALEIVFESGEGVLEEHILINKVGWGYTNIECSYEGDFLFIPKEIVAEEDFLGDNYHLPYYIDNDKLHSGINYGTITLSYGVNESFVIKIKIDANYEVDELITTLQDKRCMLELTNYYIAFRTKKLNASEWIDNSMKVVDLLIKKNEKDILARLFQIQLFITKENYTDAKWLLERVEILMTDEGSTNEIKCYFWYLMTLYTRDESFVNQITSKVEKVFREDFGNWRIAWILLYLKEEYRKDRSKKWQLLENLHSEGCNSPVIFLEAMQLINVEPTLVSELSGFGLKVLRFAIKHQPLRKNLLPQLLFLLAKLKKYEENVCIFLQNYYNLYPRVELLQGICSLLIQGNKVGETYFSWYQLAVEEGMRIIRLYEYYMMSIPLSYTGELPKSVKLYFVYRNNLQYERLAFLYVNIMKSRETFPEMAMSYRKTIVGFIKDELKRGNINKELSYLYSEWVEGFSLSQEVANDLKNSIFQKDIFVLAKNMKYVVIIHERIKGEVKYPIINGKATVSIYTDEYKLFLQCEKGNRYIAESNYKIENYLSPSKMVAIIKPYITSYLGFDLFYCQYSGDNQFINDDNEEYYARLLKELQLRNEIKRKIQIDLAEYYNGTDEERKMDDLLLTLDPNDYQKKERAIFIKYMVERNMYEEAFGWITEFGIEDVNIKCVFTLTSHLLYTEQMDVNLDLLSMVYYCYCSRKYEDKILEYLVKYYRGKIKELREIWVSATSFQVDVYDLSERIIVQKLFTDAILIEQEDIYHSYNKQGAKMKVKRAYLTNVAYHYFLNDHTLLSANVRDIELLYFDQEEMNFVCNLAVLKYYSENLDELTEKTKIMVNDMLSEFLPQKICFNFYTEFHKIAPILEPLLHYTMVEYKGNDKRQVIIHYRYLNEEHKGNYETEEMYNVYGGIYNKSFLLFYGESIQYYITENMEGKEEITESGTIVKSDIINGKSENRFSVINDIVVCENLQDYDTLNKLMKDYVEQEYLAHEFFTLL